MKKIISIVLAVSILLSMIVVAFAENTDKVTVTLDGAEIIFPDAQPFVDSRDRTLVPIRFVSEAMGAQVDWENDTQTVVIQKEKDNIRYTIGQPIAYLNGEMLVFDSFGILKEDRTFVPLRFIAEMLSCDVDWQQETQTVVITSPGEAVKFPDPKITVHYPESEYDKRMFWITLDNYREFQRNCPYYEFQIEFTNPTQFNTYEQDEGAINGWQKYSRVNFMPLTVSYNTILSVGRAFYATREDKKMFTPKEGDELEFKLTVLRKCSNESREYTFRETLKLPYPLIDVEE